MPLEPKAQLVDPQGPIDVTGVNATGITTATGGFVGQVQGSATGLAATTYNLQAGIITATRFIGDVTGTASSLTRGANITVGIMTATFVGDLLGNATGLTTTTSNLNLGIVTSTGFRGNFTGLSSGLSGTPNIQTGITTATKFLGNSTGTVVDLADDTNINVGIITATKFEGNTTGSVTDLADDTNINVGIITASKFIGNANGSVTGLADDTNINVATFTGTEFIGNTPGTAADLKSGTNLTVGTFTGTKFIGNTPGSATKLADDVNVAASTFTGTKFVGNTPGTVTDIADDTNLNMGTLTGTKFEGNTTGSVSAISDDTNLNLGTLTASQFIGNTPGNAAGISAAKNLNAGTVTATTFYGDGTNITGAGSVAFSRQTITASSSGAINLNSGNVVYLNHNADVTISFSNVDTATQVTIIRSISQYNITWPAAVKWDGPTDEPVLSRNNQSPNVGQVFILKTADGGTTWYGYEEIKSGGYELCVWGDNTIGQLGNSQFGAPWSPPPNSANPGGNQIRAVMELGSETNWTGLSGCGNGPTFGATNDKGELFQWGGNTHGQLGVQSSMNNAGRRSSPTLVSGGGWNAERFRSGCESQISLIKNDGTLWSWGYMCYGRGGAGPGTASIGCVNLNSPVQVPGTNWASNFTHSRGGGAIKTDGTLWMWGINAEGNLGQNSRTYRSSPIQIPGTTWKQGCGNGSGIAAVKTDGTLWSWGRGNHGNGVGTVISYSSPVQIGSSTDWDMVGNTRYSKTAIKTDGTMWSWGQNEKGLLGLNQPEATDQSSPVQIPGTTWKYVASGFGNHQFAIKTDGTLWGWGRADYGNLATAPGTDGYSSPIQLPGSNYYYAMTQEHSSAALRAVAPPESRYSSY